jgi:hypothetical protein
MDRARTQHFPSGQAAISFQQLRGKKCKERGVQEMVFNPLNTKLNLICHLLALLGTRPIFRVSRIRVNVKQKNSALHGL